MSELTEKNYRRINFINWTLIVPMMVLFAWPYYTATKLLGFTDLFIYPGAFIFSTAFMLTILHGHVTMALGAVHRDHYYNWLEDNPLTFGLLFNSIMTTTRFRIILFLSSIIVFVIGYLSSVV